MIVSIQQFKFRVWVKIFRARLEQLQDQACSCSRDLQTTEFFFFTRSANGSPIEGSREALHTSLHYGIEGFNGDPNLSPICEEAQATQAAESTFNSLEKSSLLLV